MDDPGHFSAHGENPQNSDIPKSPAWPLAY
jgi:hypothetical protein